MPLKQEHWPLRVRYAVFTSVLCLCATLLLGLPVARYYSQQLQQNHMEVQDALVSQAGSQAAEALFSQDKLSLSVMLSQLVALPQIAHAAVYNLEHQRLAEQGQINDEVPQSLLISYQSQAIGEIQVQGDTSALHASQHKGYFLLAFLSLLFSAVSGSLAYWMGEQRSRYLRQLRSAVEQLNEQKQLNLPADGVDDYGLLTRSIRQHHARLLANSAMQQALAKFMSPNIDVSTGLNMARNELPEQYTHAAILLIDFADLRAAQAAMPPADLADLLNHYYFFIHQAARLYNGSVDKYMGDGVMVLFGIPQADEQDCFHGICTALLLIGLLNHFNQQRREQHLPVIEFQLGMHTGYVLAGTFGDQENLSYSAIGDDIHLAAKLCHKGAAQRLLITETVLNHANLREQLVVENADVIRDARPDQTLTTFWVKSLPPNYMALIQRQVQHISTMGADAING